MYYIIKFYLVQVDILEQTQGADLASVAQITKHTLTQPSGTANNGIHGAQIDSADNIHTGAQ